MSLFQTLYSVFLVLALLFLVVTVVLFFAFRIPAIAAELSGKTRKAELAKMSQEREKEPPRRRGLTGGLNTSGQLSDGMIMTGNLTVSAPPENATTTLRAASLQPEASAQARPTGETARRKDRAARFTVRKDVMVIHTKETI